MAHVCDLKVYKEGSTTDFDPRSSFALSDANEGIAQVALPYMADDGYYLSKIFSDKMDRDVIVHVKWDSLHEEGTAFAALKSAVSEAAALLEPDYTPESYKPLKDSLDIANTLIELNDTEAPSLPDLHHYPAEAHRLKQAVNSQSVDAPEATLDSYLYCTTLPVEFLRSKIVCVYKNNQGPKKAPKAKYPTL